MKVEIYTDYIGQLTKGFEDLTNAIDKTISEEEVLYLALHISRVVA